MSHYEVIQTGSHGNAVLCNNQILIDCGVPYRTISPYLKLINIVLLTHLHADHFNKSTIRRIAIERPTLRFACGEWIVDALIGCGVKNIDVLEENAIYDYGICKVALFETYHDVRNCGWRVFLHDGKKIFHSTDTGMLDGISAIGYDIYGLEFNYDEDNIYNVIAEKRALGKFVYEEGAINSHLSFQQAQNFFNKNKKSDSILIRLHESSRYHKGEK